ncbi:MAG: hypothetical protein LBC99_06545 [Spirochaetota bacterium]|jgi:hypothetical protein|nr:hypothetical protein [Spirochaetota bacterium]
MALIENNHSAASGSDLAYWQDQLANIKILAHKYEKVILSLSRQEVESCTINTGQTMQSVRRQNLPGMAKTLRVLRGEIEYIEAKINRMTGNVPDKFVQVVPY